jgi:hypothetical protein
LYSSLIFSLTIRRSRPGFIHPNRKQSSEA